MNLDFTNKTALVCGSTAGIGKAAAIELAALGANVVLCARDEAKLRELQGQLPAVAGQRHDILVADFAKPDSVKAAVDRFVAYAQPVHILVNNTGGPPAGQAIDADVQEFRIAFNQHLVCNQVLAQAVVPGMKAAKYGRIINVISTSVKQPLKNLGVSNTIRGAVANWAKTLANVLGQFGITVNNVLPGATETGRLNSIIERKAEASGIEFDTAANQMKAAVPAGRFAQPEETAYAIAFLASPSASYINGINLPVDGGRTGCL